MIVKGPPDELLRKISYPARPLPPASVDAPQVRMILRFPEVAARVPGVLGGAVSAAGAVVVVVEVVVVVVLLVVVVVEALMRLARPPIGARATSHRTSRPGTRSRSRLDARRCSRTSVAYRRRGSCTSSSPAGRSRARRPSRPEGLRARSSRRVASSLVSVPRNATPIVPELYPSACPAVTPFPLASSPVIVSSGLGDADDGLEVVCECRPL
jgi:hypothetical protein